MKPSDSVGLVLAICHEVGNHLAAARLSAHVVAQQRSEKELDEAARAIETVAAEAAALLTHVRPLLTEGSSPRLRVAPADVVAAVQQEVASLPGVRRRLEVHLPPDLNLVEADPNVLHATLLSLVLNARTRARSRDPIRLRVSQAGRNVCFQVEEPAVDARGNPGRDTEPPRGRELILAVADHALRQAGGRARLRREADRVCAELVLPGRSPRAAGRSA